MVQLQCGLYLEFLVKKHFLRIGLFFQSAEYKAERNSNKETCSAQSHQTPSLVCTQNSHFVWLTKITLDFKQKRVFLQSITVCCYSQKKQKFKIESPACKISEQHPPTHTNIHPQLILLSKRYSDIPYFNIRLNQTIHNPIPMFSIVL